MSASGMSIQSGLTSMYPLPLDSTVMIVWSFHHFIASSDVARLLSWSSRAAISFLVLFLLPVLLGVLFLMVFFCLYKYCDTHLCWQPFWPASSWQLALDGLLWLSFGPVTSWSDLWQDFSGQEKILILGFDLSGDSCGWQRLVHLDPHHRSTRSPFSLFLPLRFPRDSVVLLNYLYK